MSLKEMGFCQLHRRATLLHGGNPKLALSVNLLENAPEVISEGLNFKIFLRAHARPL